MEQDIKTEDRLRVIHEMIEAAKNNISDNGFIWLMWGWLVFIASLFQYTAMKMELYKIAPLGWMLMPIGGIVTFIYYLRQGKQTTVKTHVDSFMKSLWIAFAVAITITIIFSIRESLNMLLPFCLVLYGIGTFVSGGALKFVPLKIGGLVCFACAVVAFNVTPENQLLAIAAGVVAGYIVPGYILKSKYKKGVQKA